MYPVGAHIWCGKVFRELLQNSDDASASAVEIHFETEAYVKRREAGQTLDGSEGEGEVEKLPDLKTSMVYIPCSELIKHCSKRICRFISGRSRTTVYCSETKIGTD